MHNKLPGSYRSAARQSAPASRKLAITKLIIARIELAHTLQSAADAAEAEACATNYRLATMLTFPRNILIDVDTSE
jgi:hypothetical protein